jgi:hypothetical protein
MLHTLIAALYIANVAASGHTQHEQKQADYEAQTDVHGLEEDTGNLTRRPDMSQKQRRVKIASMNSKHYC